MVYHKNRKTNDHFLFNRCDKILTYEIRFIMIIFYQLVKILINFWCRLDQV